MIKRKQTLIITAVMLIVSVLLLSTASLAWFTMSTAPEVSGLQVTLFTDRALLVAAPLKEINQVPPRENFTQSVNLSELFKNLAALKPISTYDGVHWFMPAYNMDGSLMSPEYFPLADPAKNMNVSIVDEDGNPLTGKALFEAQNAGYYVSCTFWLATELEEDVTVTLSAPDLNNYNLEDWETDKDNPHSFKYGSYAMAAYTKETGADGKDVARAIDNGAQNALRVGFMIEADDLNKEQKFTIYEPNANLRTLYQRYENGTVDVEKPPEANGYVYGYTINGSTYTDSNYIPTLPIKAATNEDGEIYGTVAALESDRLIVQLSGEWKASYQNAVLAGSDEEPYFPNSGDIAEFGKFIQNTSDLGIGSFTNVTDLTDNNLKKDLASQTQIVTLKGRDGDKIYPKQVTMYIWVEGQDVDCWNDIAGGTFVVNLEFAAREVIPQTPTPTE